MAERRSGAGSRLAGILERGTPPSGPPAGPEEFDPPAAPADPDAAAPARGRGAPPRKPRAAEGRAAGRIKGRTLYLPDDLFERILVQAHRRGRTISEYVAAVLERQVPDHRVLRADPPEAEDPGAAAA